MFDFRIVRHGRHGREQVHIALLRKFGTSVRRLGLLQKVQPAELLGQPFAERFGAVRPDLFAHGGRQHAVALVDGGDKVHGVEIDGLFAEQHHRKPFEAERRAVFHVLPVQPEGREAGPVGGSRVVLGAELVVEGVIDLFEPVVEQALALRGRGNARHVAHGGEHIDPAVADGGVCIPLFGRLDVFQARQVGRRVGKCVCCVIREHRGARRNGLLRAAACRLQPKGLPGKRAGRQCPAENAQTERQHEQCDGDKPLFCQNFHLSLLG